MDDERSWRGDSKVSFADAAKNAVKVAEADRGDEPAAAVEPAARAAAAVPRACWA